MYIFERIIDIKVLWNQGVVTVMKYCITNKEKAHSHQVPIYSSLEERAVIAISS